MRQQWALHQCVQSLHMKMTVYKTSTEAKFRSKATAGRRETEGRGRGRGWLGAGWELCMKWKFVQCDEQICVCMGMLIIISGEICQFIFPLYTEDVDTKLELFTCDVTSSRVK